MKKYKINNKIVEGKTVLDAIAKVKDTKYIIQHKHNSNSTVGEDGLFHFGGIKYAKRFDTISEAINHANSMSSNWEELYDIVKIKDSVKDTYDVYIGAIFKSGKVFHGNIEYIKVRNINGDNILYDEIIKEQNNQYTRIATSERSIDRFKKYLSQGEFRPVNSLYDSVVSDSYIYADLGQDYKKNADDIRKMGLKVSFMGRSDGYGMYGKIEGTRQQLERLQELGYFENEIIKDSISEEYEEIRKQIGEKKYNAIQEYLKTHKNFLLSDIYYNQDAWNNFETWYNNGMKDCYYTESEKKDKQFVKNAIEEMEGYINNWNFLTAKQKQDIGSSKEQLKARVAELKQVKDSVKDSWLGDLSKKQFAKAKEQKGLYSRTQTKYEYLVDLMKKVRPEFKIGDYVEVRFPHFIAQIIDVQFMPDSALDNENFAWQYLLKVTDPGNTTYRVGEVTDRPYCEWEFKKVSKPVFDSIRDANVDILNNLIAEEEKAIKDYKLAIENDTDEHAISLYKHILNEEIEHLEELNTLLNGRTEDFVKDMSMKRIDAIDRCYSLGKKFIEHFDKIYKNPTSLDTNHHCDEMQSWYNQVRDITLKEDKKPLSKDCLIDWFFTATGNPDNFMSNPSREELNAYNDFTYNVLLNNDVKTSINKIIKEK